MNPKLRALIWEECRTGGVISTWTVAITILCLGGMRLTDGYSSSWDYIGVAVITLCVVSMILLNFLMLYRTGNSGALTGGFSGRILLLPVPTFTLATTVIALRTLLLTLATTAILAVCRMIFDDQGPSWTLVALVPALYVWLQTLDWIRRSAPHAALAGLVPTVLFLTGLMFTERFEKYGFEGNFFPTGWSVALLVLALAVGWPLALHGVAQTRKGRQNVVAMPTRLPDALPVPGWRADHGFRGPRWALLWSYLRRDGLLLPFFTIFVSACGFSCYVGWCLAFGKPLNSGFAALDWGVWPAFVLATLIWGGLRGGAGIQRGVRPVLTEYLYPIGVAEMAATRVAGQALVLLLTWGLALAISNFGFFAGDNGLAWKIWGSALAHDFTDLREIIQSRAMLPLAALLLAWVATAIRTRLAAWTIGLSVLYAITLAICAIWYQDIGSELITFVPIAVSVLGSLALGIWTARAALRRPWVAWLWLLPLALTVVVGIRSSDLDAQLKALPGAMVVTVILATLAWCLHRRLIPMRHLLVCGFVWLLVVPACYPFGQIYLSGADRPAIAIGLLAGALVIFPYLALLIDLQLRRHHDDTPLAGIDRDRRTTWNLTFPLRIAFAGLAILTLMIGTWLRWPAKPVYVATLRAQGAPATLADLAARYAPTPDQLKTSHPYLDAIAFKRVLFGRWNGPYEGARLTNDESKSFLDSGANPVQLGNVSLKANEPLPRIFWPYAQEFHEQVGVKTAARLIEIAGMGERHFRFPINLGNGAYVSLEHLASMRDLARTLYFEAWYAAMEDRPEDALVAIRAMVPLAESLREEPLLISQLVHIAVHGVITTTVQDALNRTPFTDEQLRELQELLSTALPPMEEYSLIQQAFLGERAFNLDTTYLIGQQYEDYLDEYWTVRFDTFSLPMRLTALEMYRQLEVTPGMVELTMIEELAGSYNPAFLLAQILLPSLARAREAEYRCRTTYDTAVAACAVERYRLANGTLPPSLDALVPAYLDAVPTDPFRPDGGPVSYRIEPDGGYVLYSWAQNRKDDGGIPFDPESLKGRRHRGSDWTNGDWIFSVASLEFRNGSQFTDEIPEPEGR